MLDFTNWPESIATVSDTYKNATVSLFDPSALVETGFDVDTNTPTYSPESIAAATVAEDIPARIQPVRLSVDSAAGATNNATGEVRLRIQIPRTAYSGRIVRGWQVRVTQADRNESLKRYLFFVDSNVNSSWRASNTIEVTTNVENLLPSDVS